MNRIALAGAALGLLLASWPSTSCAGGGGKQIISPSPPPTSSDSASVVLDTLQAGAGGTYTPIAADGVSGARADPGNPLYIPPPPDPQGKSCPPTHVFHPG